MIGASFPAVPTETISSGKLVGPVVEDRLSGMVWGSLIGDALAMPAHWYYNRTQLHVDYGEIRDFVSPKNPHPGSILWRSRYTAANSKGEILHEQARYWGQRDVHYHQFLQPGENTLNLKLALELARLLTVLGRYDADLYLDDYIEFMTTPGSHNDTYVEECHREFFKRYSRGLRPRKCGGEDIHIGGLASVAILCAWARGEMEEAVQLVREHVSLTHRSRETLQAAETLARMLCDLIRGEDMAETLARRAPAWLKMKEAIKWGREPDSVVVGQRFSPACYIKEAFPATLYLAWKYADDLEAGLIANTNLGGDNCHRGAALGALLGAAGGRASVPARWRQGLLAGGNIEAFLAGLQASESGSDEA